MKKYIFGLFILTASLIACTEKKKSISTELSSETEIKLDKVEKSLNEISNEVKTKSKELNTSLQALDSI